MPHVISLVVLCTVLNIFLSALIALGLGAALYSVGRYINADIGRDRSSGYL